jgi:general secretion pathway protein J
MRSGSTIRAGEHGFTLIELLVSLALLGMAAALLLQGLATAGIVAQHDRRRATGLDEVIAAQRVLRSQVERLRPLMQINSAIPTIHFRGTGGVLTFVAPPMDRSAPDALQWFRLTRTAGGDFVIYTASLRKAGIDISGRDLVGWTPNTLLHGVRDLSITYFGPVKPGGPRQWLDTWWERSAPPDLIRIRVGFYDNDRRSWPDLVIHPQATKYGACRIDGSTGECVEER